MTRLERVVHNGEALLTFMKKYVSSTQEEVTVPWINEDGTTETNVVQNIAKLQHSALQGVAGEAGVDGAKGEKGDKGDAGQGFDIETIFNSLIELQGGSVANGKFGLVAGTLSEDHEDYGKLFLYNNGWIYVTDMSVKGAAGIQGPKGDVGIQGPKGDVGATFTMSGSTLSIATV